MANHVILDTNAKVTGNFDAASLNINGSTITTTGISSTVTSNSADLITSGGVYTYVQANKFDVSEMEELSGGALSINGVDLTSIESDMSTLQSNLSTHTSDTTIHVTSSNKTTWNAKYDKPSSGIPKTDLASAVQTSLGKADTALQSHQDISGKENISNKSTSISSSSTDTQYPSALAVKSYVEGYSNGRIYYGTCTTAKATKAKVATLVDGTGFSLAAGVIVAIKFTYASTSATMTLSVDNSTAASIMQYGTTASSSGTTTSGWPAGATVIFIYDGTNWLRSFWSNTTYSAMTQAEIDAGTSTTGRTMAPSMLVANVEMLANKVTSLSSSPTDTEYPSALAVKTYVDNNGFNPSLMPVGSGTPVITSMSQVDWNQSNSSAGDYIKNKPTVPTAAQVVAAGESGYVTGDMLYSILGDLETFLANC